MNSLRFKDSGVHLEIAEHEFLLSIQREKSPMDLKMSLELRHEV